MAHKLDPTRLVGIVAYHLGVFASTSWLSGAMYFALQDFANHPGYTGGNPFAHAPIDEIGLVDEGGNLKPAFAVAQSIYKLTAQIAPARDNPTARSKSGTAAASRPRGSRRAR